MFGYPRVNKKLSVLLNCVGLSCIGSALILQSSVITEILKNGYFRGIEQNLFVLWLEAGLTAFGIVYFAYIFARFMLSHK